MEELQVPTRRIAVKVFTSAGERLCGSLFVTDSPYCSGGPEDVIDALNDERDFLPFSADDPASELSILNKSHIVRVRLDRADDPGVEPVESIDPLQADGTVCTMILIDGSRVAGRVRFDTPRSASRLVDKFNLASGFVPVLTDHGIDFVHKAQIVRVC